MKSLTLKKNLNYTLFLLVVYTLLICYSVFCWQLSFFPTLLIIYFFSNFKLLRMLFSSVVFYLTCFSFTIAFLVILTNFLCNFHFLHINDTQNITVVLESVKQLFLFNEEDSSSRPVESKESSSCVITNKIEICHQEVRYINGEPTFVICSEQKSSVLTRNTFTTNYLSLSSDQLFLLKHYINMLEIRGCVFDKNYEDSLLLGNNAYTHSGNPNYNTPNLLVSRSNLHGFNRYQYSTQLYHFDKQILNFTKQSDLRLQQFEGDFSDQVIPINFLPQICKYDGLLITGSNEFIHETIKTSLPIGDLINRHNNTILTHFSKTGQKHITKGIKNI